MRWLERPSTAKTVLGFIDVELPSGIQILDIRLGIGPKGTPFVMMPAEQQRDREGKPLLDTGKPRGNSHVDFRSGAVREAFQQRVLEALRARRPEIFAGESGR